MPEWIGNEIIRESKKEKVSTDKYIGELIWQGLENCEGLPRFPYTRNEFVNYEHIKIKVRLGGELARFVKTRSSMKRMSLPTTVRELIQWGML